MRYSPNLNIIIQATNKISGRLARDFIEISNLQSSHFSATKFANSCYERIKKDLINDLSKKHPDRNIEFIDGQKVINSQDANYNYMIVPIDGLLNLSRSNPYFANLIALEYKGEDGKRQIIALAINNVANNELYFCEKGKGAYLNNQRIRVSPRKANENAICSLVNSQIINHKLLNKSELQFRLSGCLSLDIAYLASSRLDLCLFEKGNKILQIASLMVKEAGGNLIEKDDLILANNNKIII